jgi:hypothetical protein
MMGLFSSMIDEILFINEILLPRLDQFFVLYLSCIYKEISQLNGINTVLILQTGSFKFSGSILG